MSLQLTSGRVAGLLRCACLLLCAIQVSAFAQAAEPLVTRFVDCVRDDKGRPVESHTVRTPTFTSKQGSRAYAVVTARLMLTSRRTKECHNYSTVHIAETASEFRVAFEQGTELLDDSTIYDGNGIEAIRWSPSGDRILVEVSQWTWGTDSGWKTKYVLMNVFQQGATELPLQDALERQFAEDCVRKVASKGWLDNTQIQIEVNPAEDANEQSVTRPTPSCVQKATRFSFDVVFATLHRMDD